MSIPKKKLSQVQQVLKLVNELTPDERAEVQRKINLQDWGEKWDALKEKIEKRRVVKGLPRMTEEEVYAEFTAHRRTQRAKRTAC